MVGAGGMGEVYRARDGRLGRDVALKILPAVFALDPERVMRFDREARALATLNHPYIGSIYGVEETNGVRALALEFVEGDTLGDRLGRGVIPLDEALPIVRQIAEALEAAHAEGIVHRDLKPGNIKLRPDGTVKVLDFGLAKAITPNSPLDLTNSPTFTADATQHGVLLGTAAYMSPEQARGQAVDKRTDIWSFGCVLHEMLTGQRTFVGQSISDVLAAILTGEPGFERLPPATPQPIRRLIRRCLQKDRHNRLHDIGDARLEIQEAFAELDLPQSAVPNQGARRPWSGIPWIIAALSTLAVVVIYVGSRPTEQRRAQVTRLDLTVPNGVELFVGPSAVALSPDGQRVAFVGIEGGNRRLYVRRLDAFETRPIPGSEGATAVFFSADSRSVGFIRTDRIMKRVFLDEGVVVTLASEVDYSTGGTWGVDDRITFGRDGALWQVSASGGSPTQLTTLDRAKGEVLHAFPAESAAGAGILFVSLTAGQTSGATSIEALSFTAGGAGRTKVVELGTSPSYVSSGHLVFSRGGALLDPVRHAATANHRYSGQARRPGRADCHRRALDRRFSYGIPRVHEKQCCQSARVDLAARRGADPE